MVSGFTVGQFVEFTGAPGIGRVADIDGDSLRIEFFESVAEEAVESWRVPAKSCWPARLEPETRVYWHDPSSGDWLAGRAIAERLPDYFVRFSNDKWDKQVRECDLRVRWDRPVRDPLQVLTTGGNESGYFRDARQPLLHNLVAQRAASANTPALLSSAAEIYPHQVRAAMTVLSDPIQRYLIADEVGLGKTIVAGFVIRQTLLDNPQARVTILAPEPLRRQWVQELRDKFFIDDFHRDCIVITSHETPEKWSDYHGSELVVVDEAHALVQDSGELATPYRELAALAHAAPKLLLLSATPVTSRYITHLGLLHLLDRHLYSWDDQEAFEHRYAKRAELADSVYSMEATFALLLRSTIDEIRQLLPHDPRFDSLSSRIVECLTDDDDLRDDVEPTDLALRVEELRGHISETYRLHRRVIRHRRAQVVRPDGEVSEENEEFDSYCVRGRAQPETLTLHSSFDASEAALTDWRTGVWNHLLDAGLGEHSAPYARVLGVLASRAGGPSGDLVDSLRWRVHCHAEAAERAGLSAQERSILAGPALVPAEEIALEELERQFSGLDDHTQLNGVINTLLPVLQEGGRIVVFCGPGVLAHQLTARLQARFAKASVEEHTRLLGPEASERAVAAWRSAKASVLIVDGTAEDGLNLQVADAAVHLRMPWSPNQLEQRIGRLDRYRGPESVTQSTASRQYVLGVSAEHEALGTAWLALLRDGYKIFSASTSTLQDAIAEGLDTVWSDALRNGPAGLASAAERVRASLLEALRTIEKMDMLESIHQDSESQHDVASKLRKLEEDYSSIRHALLNYTGEGTGGINLRHIQRTVNACARDVFDLTESHPHLPPRLYTAQSAPLRPDMTQGTFNRSSALRSPGTRLFRIGNPFVDMLASLIAIDDRGQATAFKRSDPSHAGDPEPYFGFDFLVEADISPAVAAMPDHKKASLALQRQADRYLPPFTLKVWVPAGSDKALTLETACEWLNKPYNNRTDQNYNNKLVRELVEIFGGWPEYKASAEAAGQIARSELLRVTDLATRCKEAQQRASERLAVEKAQAEARRAAGRLLGDTESHLLDVNTAGYLIEGLTQPNVRLIAATCVVRSGLERRQRGA